MKKIERFIYFKYSLLLLLLIITPLATANSDFQPKDDATPKDFVICAYQENCADKETSDIGRNFIVMSVILAIFLLLRYTQRKKR